jgi:hypothetical protein
LFNFIGVKASFPRRPLINDFFWFDITFENSTLIYLAAAVKTISIFSGAVLIIDPSFGTTKATGE